MTGYFGQVWLVGFSLNPKSPGKKYANEGMGFARVLKYHFDEDSDRKTSSAKEEFPVPKITRWMGYDPESLRGYLQEGSDPVLKLRRGVIAASSAMGSIVNVSGSTVRTDTPGSGCPTVPRRDAGCTTGPGSPSSSPPCTRATPGRSGSG